MDRYSSCDVLIADDEPLMRALLSKALQNAGYQVVCAEGGAQALEYLREGPRPKLLLLDVMMPDVDGFRVLLRLRDDPKLWDLPVIMLTGRGHADDVSAGFSLGADAYLTKPVQISDLLLLVERLCPRGAAMEERMACAV